MSDIRISFPHCSVATRHSPERIVPSLSRLTSRRIKGGTNIWVTVQAATAQDTQQDKHECIWKKLRMSIRGRDLEMVAKQQIFAPSPTLSKREL